MNNTLAVIGVMALLVIMVIVVFQFIEQQVAKQQISTALEPKQQSQTYAECLSDSTKTYEQCVVLRDG